MPVYKYSVLDHNNEIVNGQIDAVNEDEARQILADEEQKVIKLKVDWLARSSAGKVQFKKIATDDIATFCKQLSIITKSGISIIKGLVLVRDQTDSKKIKELANNLSINIQKGCSLSEAFKNCGYRLPLLLVNMVKVGEISGNLDDVFRKMADYYEKETRTKKKVGAALVYPCILITIAFAVITLFSFFVLPELVGIIQDSGGQELPIVTKFMMASTRFIATNIVYIVIGVFILVFVYRGIVPYSFKAKAKELLIFKVPVVSKVATDFMTARVTRTMGTLVNAGLPMLAIMDTLEKVVGNEKLEKGIAEARDNINKGESLSASFEKIGFFDSMVTNIMSIGEETGNLGEVMTDLAEYYDEKFDSGITKAISLLEPAFTLGMGVVIGTILLSVMLPMFNMVGSLSN